MSTIKKTTVSKKELRHNLEGQIEKIIISLATVPDKKIKKLVRKAAKMLAEEIHTKPAKKSVTKKAANKKTEKPEAKPAVKKKAAKK